MNEELQNRDYIVILARSAYSKYPAPPNLDQAWENAQALITALAQKCEEFDPDGITVYTTSTACQRFNHTTSDKIAEVFAQCSRLEIVNVTDVLQDAIAEYLSSKIAGKAKPNGVIILVILDCEPDDRMEMVRLIVETTEQLDYPEEIGISFLQVGSDLLARGFIKSLDNDLSTAGAKLDIVDAKVLEELDATEDTLLTQVLLDAIYD